MKKPILILLFVLLALKTYSQDFFTNELKWESSDSIQPHFFKDSVQLEEWGKKQLPFSQVDIESFSFKDCKYSLVMIVGCSGIPCWEIYILKRENGFLKVIKSANARVIEQIEVTIDNKLEKIIFKTKSSQLRELTFDKLQ